jgi:hypothetical protein
LSFVEKAPAKAQQLPSGNQRGQQLRCLRCLYLGFVRHFFQQKKVNFDRFSSLKEIIFVVSPWQFIFKQLFYHPVSFLIEIGVFF